MTDEAVGGEQCGGVLGGSSLERQRLRAAMPSEIADVWFDFDWDIEKTWAAAGHVIDLRIEDCEWLLRLPVWRDTETGCFWRVRPLQVLADPHRYSLHAQRVENADLDQPVTAMRQGGRLLLLDGYHRLAKAHRDGTASITAKVLSRDQIADIEADS